MFDRVVGASFALLFAAAALYIAVQLIESIAATLLVIVAAIGGLMLLGLVARAVWSMSGRRGRFDRW